MTEQDPKTTTDQHVRFERDGGLGRVVLDRPKAINALSVAMMVQLDEQLRAWREDPAVTEVEIRGEGERGFCSGADVREIRELVLTDPDAAVGFFELEYGVNQMIATFPKPVTSRVHGISMGGGLGLALHARHVVAEPSLQLAMPETTIGLFPDVGINWQLASAPGETGTYLAMTGQTINAASARYAQLVDEVTGGVPEEPSQLERDREWIDECFAGDDAAQMLERLEEHPKERARQTAEVLAQKSPLSVCVALEAVRRAGRMTSVSEVLAQDLTLARNFVADSDFVEGVRAQLVDKDRNPTWRHVSLDQVPVDCVQRMFR